MKQCLCAGAIIDVLYYLSNLIFTVVIWVGITILIFTDEEIGLEKLSDLSTIK